MCIPTQLTDVVKNAFSSRQHAEYISFPKFQDWKKSLSKKYSILGKTCVGGDRNAPSEKIRFDDVMWMNFGEFQSVEHPDEMWFKYSLDEAEPWKKINMRKRSSKMIVHNMLTAIY